MTPRVDVIGMGAVTWDRFLVVPRYPGPEEKVRAIRAEECAGGVVATALMALQRWGLTCRLATTLGFDPDSRRILERLEREGIILDAVQRREDVECRSATILVDNRNGHRTMISGPEAFPSILSRPFPENLFEGARVLHLDTNVDEGCVELARKAKAAGLFVTLDAERPANSSLDLMRLCDYTIATIDFAQQVTGEEKGNRAAYALSLQAKTPVVVTDGPRGCYYASEQISVHQPAYEVPVVDSTGAGDVFHAAFIYGLLAAWDIRKVLRFAAWAGAYACRELGGQKGVPSLDAVHDFIRQDHLA